MELLKNIYELAGRIVATAYPLLNSMIKISTLQCINTSTHVILNGGNTNTGGQVCPYIPTSWLSKEIGFLVIGELGIPLCSQSASTNDYEYIAAHCPLAWQYENDCAKSVPARERTRTTNRDTCRKP